MGVQQKLFAPAVFFNGLWFGQDPVAVRFASGVQHGPHCEKYTLADLERYQHSVQDLSLECPDGWVVQQNGFCHAPALDLPDSTCEVVVC